MKVARLIDYKKFEFTDSDIKEPSDGECLLKVKVVSICGTDIRREFNKKTSHPFTLNNQYLAHNGVLENDRDLIEEYNLEGYNDVDSSVILPLKEKIGFDLSKLSISSKSRKIEKVLYFKWCFYQ